MMIVILTINFKSPILKTNNSSFNLTSEIEKIEMQYATPPDTTIKIEPDYDSSYAKIESLASEEMRNMIMQILDSSYSKVTAKNQGHQSGVFKSGGSCGIWPTLEVFNDCEDHLPASKKYGWTGDSYVDASKNIHYSFCVVNGIEFERTYFDYAILCLSNIPYVTDFFIRVITNEKHNNTNYTTWNGQDIYSTGYNTGWVGESFFSPDNGPLNNTTRLAFYYYRQYNYGTWKFPNIGIDYGVLGRFGHHQGYIYSDDEDDTGNNAHDNHNGMSITVNYVESTAEVNIPNIMDSGYNTRFYLSKTEPDNFCNYPNNF